MTKKAREHRQVPIAPKFVLVVVGLVVVVAAAFFNFESVGISDVASTTSNGMTRQAADLWCSSSSNATGSDHHQQQRHSALTTNEVPTGGIFYCGYRYPELAKLLFPEYANNTIQAFHGETNEQVVRAPTAQDILIHGMHGPCVDSNQQHHDPLEFPGKILFVQGEASGGDWTRTTPHHSIEGVYQIGMLPDTPHSILAYYGIILFTDVLHEVVPLFLDSSKKPKNTGEHAAIIYVARNCAPFREQAVDSLSTYIPVHYGSDCQGRAGRSIPAPDREVIKSSGYTEMMTVVRKYQFCMVMENRREPLYITEKILWAFRGGCIPIYYGPDEVFDVFNRNAFVFYDVADPVPALEQMKYLAQNHTAYLEMLNGQPILAHGEQTVRDYFSFADDVGGGHLKHKLRAVMGIE